jgi:hypothetical protein
MNWKDFGLGFAAGGFVIFLVLIAIGVLAG